MMKDNKELVSDASVSDPGIAPPLPFLYLHSLVVILHVLYPCCSVAMVATVYNSSVLENPGALVIHWHMSTLLTDPGL